LAWLKHEIRKITELCANRANTRQYSISHRGSRRAIQFGLRPLVFEILR